MTWAKWIVAYLFDCVHRHTTWPQRGRAWVDYVCCLDCGREFPYSTRSMRIVSADLRLKDRSPYSGQTSTGLPYSINGDANQACDRHHNKKVWPQFNYPAES